MTGFVFIERGIDTQIYDKPFKKCIFADQIESVPNVGHKIEIQGMVVTVNEVIHNFNDSSVEFTVDGSDDKKDFEEIDYLFLK